MIIFSNSTYNKLKFLTQILLPALGTLYFTLAGIWGLPSAEEVVGTIVAIDTFLGVALQLSTNAYNKSDERFDGSLDIHDVEGDKKSFMLNLNGDPAELQNKDEIRFKVRDNT